MVAGLSPADHGTTKIHPPPNNPLAPNHLTNTSLMFYPLNGTGSIQFKGPPLPTEATIMVPLKPMTPSLKIPLTPGTTPIYYLTSSRVKADTLNNHSNRGGIGSDLSPIKERPQYFPQRSEKVLFLRRKHKSHPVRVQNKTSATPKNTKRIDTTNLTVTQPSHNSTILSEYFSKENLTEDEFSNDNTTSSYYTATGPELVVKPNPLGSVLKYRQFKNSSMSMSLQASSTVFTPSLSQTSQSSSTKPATVQTDSAQDPDEYYTSYAEYPDSSMVGHNNTGISIR